MSGVPTGFARHNVNDIDWTTRDRYADLVYIGGGSFGDVCWASDSATESEVAIKRATFQIGPEIAKLTYRELAILSRIEHENLITLLDVFTPQQTREDFKEVYFVMPYAGADLRMLIENRSLDDDQIQFFTYQILRGLKYLHSGNILHRDLSPRNIAVDSNNRLRIIDFGMACQMREDMTAYVISRPYRSPELFFKMPNYSGAVDIWSVACILVEMKTGSRLFKSQMYLNQLEEILVLAGKPDANHRLKLQTLGVLEYIDGLNLPPRREFEDVFPWASPQQLDFLKKTLVLNPEERLTATEALAHPYFGYLRDGNDEPTMEPFTDESLKAEFPDYEQWKDKLWDFIQNYITNHSE